MTQKRFFYLPGKGGKSTNWAIPVMIHSDVKDVSAIISSASAKIDLGKEPKYYIVNAGKTGFYRVSYDKENLSALKDIVMQNKLSTFDKWGVQNDLYAFCRAGNIEFDAYLNFIEAFSEEKDYLVCKDISEHLHMAYSLAYGKLKNKIKAQATEFYTKIIDNIGFDPAENEEENTAVLRTIVLLSAGRMGNEFLIKEARKRFEGQAALHPDIKTAVYALAAWQGDKQVYAKLLELYKRTDVPEEKRRLIAALAGFSDAKIIKEAFRLALSKHVKLQDAPIFIIHLAHNPRAQPLVLKWIKENWDELEKRYGKGGNTKLLEKIIGSLGMLNKEEYKKGIVKFFKTRKHEHINKSLNQALESIDINMQFMKANNM